MERLPASGDSLWSCVTCNKCGFTYSVREPPEPVVNPFSVNTPKELLGLRQRQHLEVLWDLDDFGEHYRNPVWSRCPKADNIILAREIRNWGQNLPASFGLSGSIGIGKTAATGLMMIVLASRNEFDFSYAYAPSLFSFLSSYGQRSSEQDRMKHERLCSSKYLFIDDAGIEDNVDWKSLRFNELIEKRYSKGLFHVVTSNLSRESLAQREGWERAVDRIVESAINWYEMGGPSQRAVPQQA